MKELAVEDRESERPAGDIFLRFPLFPSTLFLFFPSTGARCYPFPAVSRPFNGRPDLAKPPFFFSPFLPLAPIKAVRMDCVSSSPLDLRTVKPSSTALSSFPHYKSIGAIFFFALGEGDAPRFRHLTSNFSAFRAPFPPARRIAFRKQTNILVGRAGMYQGRNRSKRTPPGGDYQSAIFSSVVDRETVFLRFPFLRVS